MITLVVIAILSSIGIPSYQKFVRTNRLATVTNDLVTDLALARAEAIKQRAQIGVCRSDGTACIADASWERGWSVFLDSNADSAWTAASDGILRSHDSLPAEMAITATTGSAALASPNLIVFAPSALTATTSSYRYEVCHKKLGKKRVIDVDFTGRSKLTEGDC